MIRTSADDSSGFDGRIPGGRFLSFLQRGEKSYDEGQRARETEGAAMLAVAELCAMTAHQVIHAIAFTPRGMERPTIRAGTTMLLRALDDLDAFMVLAIAGYPIQAGGLGASLWEKSQCAVLVASHEDDAKRWIANGEREDSENEFWRTAHFEKGFVRLAQRLGWTAYTYKRAKEDYKALCDAKHPHPSLMQSLGIALLDDALHFTVGPVYGQGWRHAVGSYAPIVLRTIMWATIGVFDHHELQAGSNAKQVRTSINSAMRALHEFSKSWNQEFERTTSGANSTEDIADASHS